LMFDEAFDRWTGRAKVVTRLTGRLSPDDMKTDSYPQWDPYRYQKPVVFSYRGASITALNVAVAIVVAGWLAVFLMESGWKVTPAFQRTWYLRLLLAGIVVGLTVYFLLPKTAVKLVSLG